VNAVWNRIRDFARPLLAKRAVRWSLDVVLVVIVVNLVAAWQSRDAVTGHAPALSLASLDGGAVTSEQLRGKPTLLVFWAPWCTVCRAESGAVSTLAHVVGDHANVFSIASDYDNLEAVRRYVRDRDVDYPVLLGDTRAARAYRVRAFPTLYFLDDNGDIRHVVTGYTTLGGMLWRLFVAHF
jgi:thiol-disulfide isomerase/thioredoxin